jgi:Fur family ferric uptake transcriptional regulator
MKDEKLLPVARETLERYLKVKGLRRTPERFALLERVFSSAEHFYVDVLCEAMELEGYHVSQSTVYATMQLFLDAGLVRRHQFGNQPAQYERSLPGLTKNHLHLVCSVCGRVKEVRDAVLSSDLLNRNYAGFKAESCGLYVYGVCLRCQRRNNSSRIKTNHKSGGAEM